MNTTKEVDVIIYEDFSFKEFLATLCLEMKPNAKTEEVKRAIDNACKEVEIPVLTLPSIDCLIDNCLKNSES